MGEGVNCLMPSYAKSTTTDESGNVTENKFAATGTSANFVYGGGQQGNVIGVTNVDVLNGHIFKSVTGGSYSGYVWGSTQVKVGYPKYYQVKAGQSGIYNLNRADQKNNTDDGKTIKQTINLMAGDLITEAVYNAIKQESKSDYFEEMAATTPTMGWDNVNIKIGEAVYGGGYSLAQGSSVMANNTTVLKYTQQYNPGTAYIGYGGNTTILIADRAAQPSSSEDASTASTSEDRDHIIISRQDMEEAKVAAGQDLLGYYYLGKDGSYHYIYQAGVYYKGGTRPDGAEDGDKVYEYDNEGGVFGDGHLSYAQGFRSADITGYGFAGTTINSPKIINTFQRMDILRLTDNCISLLGARDYATNATDKTPYSISRVGEIQMQATDNVLTSTTKTKDGTKTTEAGLADNKTNRSRNYMGFANNIHYVGALTSNVAFTDTWYDENGKQTNYQGATTYMAVKQKYIDEYYKETDETKRNKFLFEKRNNGTAKNMIGIASGYALKIQNAQEKEDGTETLYYGPIIGVVEMNLIDVREDEGGGYVYADNIHKRDNTTDSSEGSNEASGSYDFLETSGNFVFPYSVTQGRYIVDDCFHVGYDALKAENEDPDYAENAPAHYWYVTGFNYHYTAHITGFTYDKEHNFLSNNQDGIVALSGLKGGQKVEIESWKMYSAHDDDYPCDLEKRNYSTADADKEAAGKYILYVSASNNSKQYNEEGFAAQLSMKEGASKDDCKTMNKNLPVQLTSGDAKIIFQLTDKNVNNNANGYYRKHLSEPCKATLVLSAPAQDENNNTLLGKVALSKLYTMDSNGKYTAVVTGKLAEGTTYYYKNGETEKYQELANTCEYFTRNKDNLEFSKVNRSDVELGAKTIYYCEIPRYYTYTIDLTIEYIQGPNITGQITVENCALPGERIRVKKDKLVINADQAFSVNGYYWRIGKREYDATTEKWDFSDKEPWKKDSQAKGYDTFNQSDKEGKGLFKDCRYDMTEDYLEIPAYYYMNGYGIQLGVTMNIEGMENTILPIDMTDADQLVVHNYHRMDPHKEGFDLHLADAIKRVEEGKKADASEADKNFAEPRIYLADQKDLTAFIAFVDSIGANSKNQEVPRYGKNAQFILQNDLTMLTSSHDGSQISDFAGTLHGNGHVINGLAEGNCLFNRISGNVYNLGLTSGKISNNAAADGKIAQYHCCYEYAPTAGSTPIIYKMDGKLDEHYTTEDFRLGKAAYDLNAYYLCARQSNSTEEDKQALKYVYDYFANGDYQYAQRTDAITGKNTGITYLRTGKDSDLPNYEQAETRHDKTHTFDPARHNTETGIDQPLFNTADMNDFLFWGQSLQSTPANYPTTISSHQVSYMANRVYRTAGYYGDTLRGEYHYNAYSHGSNYMDTYVHNPATTAIDFCYEDDNATIFHDFIVKDGVTQNLLVYTGANDENSTTDAYDIVSKALSYSETTKESLIHGHHIAKAAAGDASASGSEAGTYSTPLLHLVERTPQGENSEGESSDNNNFCAPIAFQVSNHAWYTRKPQYYANDASGAWEGICLPFMVDKAEASLNGEITHFYGKPSEEEVNNPAENTHSLHHEYWLRGMMKVENENNALNASFERPGSTDDGLFEASTGTSFNYVYYNPFFVDTYDKLQYNKDANPYYAESHTYKDYLPLMSGVPYIVRFPGERYYEFDLSSKFYNNLISGRSEQAQAITFHAFGRDNTTETSHGSVVIPITATMQTAVNDGYAHKGIFTATQVAEGAIYGMNVDGSAFDDASTLRTVMPFRTVIAKESTARSRASIIKISESSAIDKIIPEVNKDNGEETTNGDYLIIRPIGGHRVRIESSNETNLNVYSTTGQLYRILDIRPGTATYSGFPSGIYIFGNKKIMIK